MAKRSGLAALALMLAMPATSPAQTPAPAQVTSSMDVIYATHPTGPLHLDLHRPAGKVRAPVLVVLHGGGWARGERPKSWTGLRPFVEAGYAIVSVQYRLSGTAQAPAAVQDAMEPTAVAVAESALVPPPAADADHLIELAEGVEGQVWRSGRLLATRWWPAVPGDDAWLQFLRSASVEPMAGRPALQSVTLADAPWGRSVQRFAWSAAQLERAFWRALVVVLGLLVGWQAAATAAWSIADAWQSSRLEGLRAESAPLIDARERAEAAQARMEALVGLVAPSSDYVLVAEVKQRLPDDARLVGWLRDPVSLRVALRTGERDPRVFVQAFSDHPDLRAVQANPTERGADIELLFDLESSRAEEEG